MWGLAMLNHNYIYIIEAGWQTRQVSVACLLALATWHDAAIS